MAKKTKAEDNFSEDQKLFLGILFGALGFILLGVAAYLYFPSFAVSNYDAAFDLEKRCNCHSLSNTDTIPLNIKQQLEERKIELRGSKGDAIGGTLGPGIALIGAFLTFLAFYIQIRANKQQTLQFKEQAKDIAIDRFENKFYELIRLHQANVEEVSISGYKDRKIERRKAFSYMYRELRFTFFVVKIKYNDLKQSQQLNVEYDDERLLRLAYILFYVGIGDNSDKLSTYLIGNEFDQKLSSAVITKLKEILDEISNLQLDINKDKAYPKLEIDGLGTAVLSRSYKPFNGHLSRFGHYYRHLFQAVKFVVNQHTDLIKPEQKLEYLKTLRAQLSDHEQLMLYYNAISRFGKPWIDNKYFTDFKMIHNIPLPLADFGITPQKKFEKELAEGMDLFEW